MSARAPHHVVITGASSGLGAALAQHYARAAGMLTLAGRNEARLESIAHRCQRLGATVVPVSCDVSDPAAMERWIIAADERRAVDLLIANAGIGGSRVLAGTAGESGELARRIIGVNTIGVFNTVAPLLPRFVARQSGYIALISSMAALRGLAEAPAYSASKAAVRVYGQGLRALLRAQGVGVTVACPGFIATPMSASLPFAPPFLLSAENAARVIARGIARGRPEIMFPWQMRWAAAIASQLPHRAADRIFSGARQWLVPR